MLIYHQQPEGKKRADDHDEGLGKAVCGIMIYMQFFFVIQSLISTQCSLRFRLVCPIIYFYFKIFSFLSRLIVQYFTSSKYVVECSSEIKILEND